jgi:Gas vesicle synthesis protein GvpL/GvpF/Lsr2
MFVSGPGSDGDDQLRLTGWNRLMATVTEVTLTCDVCGDAKDVKTRMFGLDGKAYEIDLCREDGNALGTIAAGYIAKARKITARPGHRRGQRQRGDNSRVRAATAGSHNGAKAAGTTVPGRVTGSRREEARTSRSEQQVGAVRGATAAAAGSQKAAKAFRRRLQDADGASAQAAKAADARRQTGIWVYGILPADIEVADETPGVGEHPGLLRAVRFGDLAALISDVEVSGRLGRADDLRTHREILDATAAEVPIVPLQGGTVLASEDAVAEELLAARCQEFTAALEQLEGRAEFQVKGRYVKDMVLGAVLSRGKKTAGLRQRIHGQDPDAARHARIELDQLINAAVAAWRGRDTRALEQAMDTLCVARIPRQPAHQLDAVHVAFLVAVDDELKVEQVIEDLAREWEGRIDVQLLGPMAAYDFAGTAQPES